MSITEHNVRDHVVLLAGAGGIATAAAARLGAGGAKVAVADLVPEAAERAAQAVRDNGGHAVSTSIDISEEDSVKSFIDLAVAEFGRIDSLVNIAAGLDPAFFAQDKDVLETSLPVWQQTLDVNLTGYFLTIRSALPHMLKTGGGSIVNFISAAAYVGETARVSYGVSKAGLMALTRHVANRWGKEGVRCNGLAPGTTLTPTAKKIMSPDFEAQLLDELPNTRLGTPDDIAVMIMHLVSDDGAWINGQCFNIDGGSTMRP
jgi:NAD(P)-dependent dehydrogenase (short-subunit alcohol dehydrogenase family)